jgi:MFS family permease
LSVAVTLSRVSVSMLSLSLLVAATQAHGYGNAGLVMLVYAVSNAAVGPIRGRLADRYPPRLVLLGLLGVHLVAFVVLYLALASGAAMPVLAGAGMLLGLSVPPTGPVVRGLWPTVVPASRLATAYAFDAALNTITFVAGPLLAGVLLLAMPAHVVVAATGVFKIVGDTLVAIAPTVRNAPKPGERPVHRGLARLVGPLVHSRVRLLLLLMGLDTFTFGCLEVAAVAAASGQGSAGVLTSVLALGAAISGLAYGARTWPGRPGTQLLVLSAVGAAALAGGAPTSGMVLAGVVFAVFGLVNGPVETVKQVLIGEASPEHQRIEVFSWVFSVMWLGFGIGTTVAGQLASSEETTAALLVAAAAQTVAVCVTAIRVPSLRQAPATA